MINSNFSFNSQSLNIRPNQSDNNTKETVNPPLGKWERLKNGDIIWIELPQLET